MLAAQRFAQLDARDLDDRIPLISGLQRPREQRLLANRLLGELRVDAAAAKKSNSRTPLRQAVSITWVWILRFSSRKSAG
jgi:hypothetical protein